MRANKHVDVHMTSNAAYNSLHFGRRLPSLRLPGYHPMAHVEPSLVVRTPESRRRIALYLARRNAGQFSVEFGQPVVTYRSLLEELVKIDGLISVHQANEYTIEYEVARLFNRIQIGITLADLFTRHLLLTPAKFTAALDIVKEFGKRM